MKFDCYLPTKILFGAGRLNDLATAKLPGKKALIVISAGTSMRKYGYLERVQKLLASKACRAWCLTKFCPIRFWTTLPKGRNWRAKKGAILLSAWGEEAVLILPNPLP